MPVSTFTVPAGNCDGQVYDTSTLEATGTSFGFGKDDRGSGLKIFECYCRFTSVNIQPKSPINSATLTFYNVGAGPFGHATATIYGCDEDNSGVISTAGDYYSRSLTTANLGFAPAGTGTIATGDIKSIVQEVIDRSGFTYGNAMQFELRNTYSGGSECKTFLGAYEGGYYSQLSIDWTSLGRAFDITNPVVGLIELWDNMKRRTKLYNDLRSRGAVDLGKHQLLPI